MVSYKISLDLINNYLVISLALNTTNVKLIPAKQQIIRKSGMAQIIFACKYKI